MLAEGCFKSLIENRLPMDTHWSAAVLYLHEHAYRKETLRSFLENFRKLRISCGWPLIIQQGIHMRATDL